MVKSEKEVKKIIYFTLKNCTFSMFIYNYCLLDSPSWCLSQTEILLRIYLYICCICFTNIKPFVLFMAGSFAVRIAWNIMATQ